MSIKTTSEPILGLSAKYFTDDQIHQQIKYKVFFRTWQFACHESRIRNKGDYLTLSLLDQDILVVRDAKMQLQAFYNVCQHRGHRLLEGQGNKQRISCPYHAWTYDLGGQLIAAPNSGSVSNFDVSSICIPKIRVENFLGFIFINLDEQAPDLDECYPGVRAAILDLCPDIESRKFAFEHHINEGCNWMTAVENYNECYHCKLAHAEFSKGIIDPSSYRIAPFGRGRVLAHTSRPTQSSEAWYEMQGSDYASYYLWPTSSIQIYPGGMVNTYYWRPLSVDDVCVYRGWYSEDGEITETLQKVIDRDYETTFSEDLKLVRNVQRGLHSIGYRPGPLIVDPAGGIDNELSISVLHQWLRESLGELQTNSNSNVSTDP
ncbi:MAG: aromatic ring-hydroxylating dioxygenase subunit alpha [Gammaproteobacteria bacterium]|nr:aromatic ring-hydroxylating dioxygenase subunit alpha [Gammaproteobacteria bacterium]MCY4219913.1 aromatic ring-hydroxylating dioxygenase subunit alpha [Gammaproteobacteria bacterium]MCY4275608.1 aromatic ring-hydroxylating dioxygenase subunit alpha [Gammaproteobacteria bacterium]